MENKPEYPQGQTGDQFMQEQETFPAPHTTDSYMAQKQAENASAQLVQWRASEYITKEKNNLWFIWLGIAVLVFLAISIFLMRDVLFSILIIVMGIAVAVFAKRPAKEMTYQLSADGLSVNEKFFPFRDFRAFGILREGALYSISLLPLKRFSPSVNIYFPSEYGETIVDVLGARLPMEELEPDFIDQLTNKLHF